MSWLADIWRGITGGSKGSSQSTSTPTEMQAPEFQALRSPFASALSNTMATGGPAYTGEQPMEFPQAGSDLIASMRGMVGPGTDRAAYLRDVLGGKYLQPGSNPFFDSYIQAMTRPLMEAFTEANRQLGGRFTQAGQQVQPQSSSAFDRAAALALRSTQNAMADVTAKFGAQVWEGERGRMQQGVQLSQAEVDTAKKQLDAETLPNLLSHMNIQDALALHQQRWNQILQTLQLMGQVTQPVIAQTAQSTGTTSSIGGLGALGGKGGGTSPGGGGGTPA